jgi:DNA replication protein DnaC
MITNTDSEMERQKIFICERTGREFEGLQTKFGDGWFPDHRFHPDIVEQEEKKYLEEEKSRKKMAQVDGLLRIWHEECPPIMKETEINKLPPEPYKKVMDWEYGEKGLMLHGSTGKGKTRTLWMLLKKLSENGIGWRHYPTKRLAQVMSYDFGRKRPEYLRACIKAKVLSLDDLGKENATPQWEADIFEIIDTRANYKKPTIITTNFTGDKLMGKFKDNEMANALVRRLREFYISVPFK